MKPFSIILIILLIIVSGCSVCRFKQISQTEIYGNNKIEYYRINPKCPANSSVKGYNEQGYLFYIWVLDSTKEQSVYHFYRDSVAVKKMQFYKNGHRVSYKLSYDSGFDIKLTYIEYHIFNRLTNYSDSLGVKNLNYLSTAKGFKIKSEFDITTRKWISHRLN